MWAKLPIWDDLSAEEHKAQTRWKIAFIQHMQKCGCPQSVIEELVAGDCRALCLSLGKSLQMAAMRKVHHTYSHCSSCL